MDSQASQISEVSRVVDCLKRGLVAGFPTDTVYGIGVAVDFAKSPFALNSIKKSPADKPIAWLVGGIDSIYKYTKNPPAYAIDLAKKYWPGALTLIFNANENVNPSFLSNSNTVALRMPDCKITQNIINSLLCPVATTSANFTGKPPVCSYVELDPKFAELIPAYITDNKTDEKNSSGVASTIIDCTGKKPVIIREGDIKL